MRSGREGSMRSSVRLTLRPSFIQFEFAPAVLVGDFLLKIAIGRRG